MYRSARCSAVGHLSCHDDHDQLMLWLMTSDTADMTGTPCAYVMLSSTPGNEDDQEVGQQAAAHVGSTLSQIQFEQVIQPAYCCAAHSSKLPLHVGEFWGQTSCICRPRLPV